MAVARNTAWVLGAQLVASPLQLVVAIILARWLGAGTYGQLQACLTLLWTGALALPLGHVSALIFQVRQKVHSPAEAAGQGLFLVGCTAMLAVLVAWPTSPWLRSELLLGAPSTALLMLSAALPFLLTMQIWGAVARATDRFDLWAAAIALQPAVVLVGIGALVLRDVRTLSPALALYVAALASAAAVLGISLARQHGLALRMRWTVFRQAMRFGLAGHASVLLAALHERADVFLLAALLQDPAVVGVYAVAVQIANRVRVLPLALGSALYPALSDHDASHREALAAAAARLCILGVVVVAALIALTAKPLLPLLFGSEFTASLLPLALLLPATVAHGLRGVLFRYFQAIDHQRVNVMLEALGVLCNTALNLWAIPRWGAAGAAGASLISYTMVAGGLAWVFLRRSELHPRSLVPGPADARRLVERLWAQ